VNMGVMLMKAHANVAVVYRSPTKNSHWVSEALYIYIYSIYAHNNKLGINFGRDDPLAQLTV
jgi:hypothetical protein